LVIEPLGPAGETSWTVSGATTISEPEDDGSAFAMRPPQLPLGRMGIPGAPFGQAAKITRAAEERATYTLGKASGTTVVIHRTYELKTADRVAGKPVV